jgi:hypothetical protein
MHVNAQPQNVKFTSHGSHRAERTRKIAETSSSSGLLLPYRNGAAASSQSCEASNDQDAGSTDKR